MAKIGRLVKESMVNEVTSELTDRPNFFVTSVSRLAPADSDSLRKKLFEARAVLKLYKIRLGKRVLDGLKIDGAAAFSEGQGGALGFVLTQDDVLPVAKHLVDFIKEHENTLAIRGAVVEGQLLQKKEVEQLASLPPKAQLLAQVVGTIETPLADVIFTVERLIGDLIWASEQAATKVPAQAAAPSAEAKPGEPAQS